MKIPYIQLRSQHAHLVDDIIDRTRQLFETNDFVNGQAVLDFEKQFAQYIGVRHAVAVKSVSDALLLALRALDVMPGDDVLVPAFGSIDSPEQVARLYANPVFVDIEPNTYGIDPMQLQQAVTDKTRAIIVSHLYGSRCTIDQIHQFAEANGILVVEDASSTLGATYMNKKVGTFGIAGAYSFSPDSNLGGAGDGGMVVTDDDAVAERIIRLREHGRSDDEFSYEEVGISSQMDSFQALVLRLKMEELEESNADRIENARLYDKLLENTPIKRPRFTDDHSRVFSHYTIEHDQRDQLMAFLKDKGIGTKVIYPSPLHLQLCFEYLEYAPGSFAVAESVCKRVLSLPIYPGLKKREIEEVAAAVQEFFSVAAQ